MSIYVHYWYLSVYIFVGENYVGVHKAKMKHRGKKHRRPKHRRQNTAAAKMTPSKTPPWKTPPAALKKRRRPAAGPGVWGQSPQMTKYKVIGSNLAPVW